MDNSKIGSSFNDDKVFLYEGDVLDVYSQWSRPTVIVSDGPYGVSGFPGDPRSPNELAVIYEPHVAAWSAAASPQTTLWFWNTEVGWANVHPVLLRHGWLYRGCNIWDKGIAHVAGNCNGKTMKRFPTVTEVCVQYYLDARFGTMNKQDWLRHEWARTGLPFSKANEACGVKSAATRKYLASDHLFYSPTPDAFAKLAIYANKFGDENGAPYFDVTSAEMADPSLIVARWAATEAKFNFEYGVSNVWSAPANRGRERLKVGGSAVHLNQKPLALIERLISASSDEGDVVWDPFCGTGTTAVAAIRLSRQCFTAEMNPDYATVAKRRIASASK